MDTQELIIIEVFCQQYEIETHLIHDLEEFGLLQTVVYKENKYINKNELAYIEKLIRLHNDLNINKEGIDVVLELLTKVNQLQLEVKYLKNRLEIYE